MRHWILAAFLGCSLVAAPVAEATDKGLSEKAEKELRKAGLFKYLGAHAPASSTPHAGD